MIRPRLGRAGVAVVEFALTSMVLLGVIVAILEGGELLVAQHTLDNAVVAAARFAVVHGSRSSSPASSGDVKNAFNAAAAGSVLGNGPVVTVSFNPDNSPGSSVSVSATYNWTPVASLADWAALTLSAQANFTIQN